MPVRQAAGHRCPLRQDSCDKTPIDRADDVPLQPPRPKRMRRFVAAVFDELAEVKTSASSVARSSLTAECRGHCPESLPAFERLLRFVDDFFEFLARHRRRWHALFRNLQARDPSDAVEQDASKIVVA